MIQMLYKKGRYCPQIVCDVCHLPINDAQLGAVICTSKPTNDPEMVDVWHLHKGRCHDVAEAQCGGPTIGWDELSNHILHLVQNAGLSPADLDQIESMHEEIGLT